MSFDAAALPIHAVLPDLRRALSARTRVVLEAAPGAGKSTVVPLSLRDAAWLQQRQIWMLEPRRLAAQATARRLAWGLGEDAPGQSVGLLTRDHRQVSRQSQIIVVTEGILTQRLQDDPELAEIGIVIFDEFHERSVHADLGLALCRDVQSVLRPDLRLLLMSATLDGRGLAQTLDAPHLSCPGRMFPVAQHTRPMPLEAALNDGLRRLLHEIAARPGGSILVFLPGEAEIRRAERALETLPLPVFPLYARLPPVTQEQALHDAQRRVILATAVAETSITVAGVDTVIDAGWARYAEFDPAAGHARLVTRRVTRAQAAQRAGRAGRTGPGVVWQLWSAEESLDPALPPEVQRADLGRTVLELARWGDADVPWLDLPHPAHRAQAEDLLRRLQITDADGRLNARGQAVARVPLDPRPALLLHAAAQAASPTVREQILEVLSLLGLDRALPREPVDLERLVEQRRAGRLDAPVQAAATRVRSQLERLLRRRVDGAHTASPADEPAVESLLDALLRAYPDRVALPRESRGQFRLSGGGGAQLVADHPLAVAEALIIVDMDGGREGRIRRAFPLTRAALEARTRDRQRIAQPQRLDPETGRIVARRERYLGSLLLESQPLPVRPGADAEALLCAALRDGAWSRLPWSPAQQQWRARVQLLRAAGHALPDCRDTALQDELEDWLGPFLTGATALDHLRPDVLQQALDYRLSAARGLVEREAPAQVELNGQRFRLDYTAENGPVLAAEVQWFYGLECGPAIAQGQHPVCLHLLSPARRPLAVTRDLASFWRNAWSEVRGQMRSRYPKHDWPQDPARASLPERFARRLRDAGRADR
ncbi:MAG: ATP-dependent helicase HrpB [Oceanococcaceae bacterium]